MAERKIAKWVSESDPAKVRRLGKTLEELGELVAVLARCLIQGSEEIDPGTGRLNIDRMTDELADAMTQMRLTADKYHVDITKIDERMEKKTNEMREWERHFLPEACKDCGLLLAPHMRMFCRKCALTHISDD